MNTVKKGVWVIDLNNLPTEGFKNPLELGMMLGIPRRDTLLLVMAISDALLGLCGALPTMLSDLRAHAKVCYSDVIEIFMNEHIDAEAFPDDILPSIPGHMLQLKCGIIEWAVGLIGQAPRDTREIRYICQMKRRLVMLQITQEDQDERAATVQRQVSETLSQHAA